MGSLVSGRVGIVVSRVDGLVLCGVVARVGWGVVGMEPGVGRVGGWGLVQLWLG